MTDNNCTNYNNATPLSEDGGREGGHEGRGVRSAGGPPGRGVPGRRGGRGGRQAHPPTRDALIKSLPAAIKPCIAQQRR